MKTINRSMIDKLSFPHAPTLTLADLSNFISVTNIVKDFRTKWGNDYFDKASDTWALSVKSFKDNSELNMSLEEMIFCMEYDYVLGPSIGVPENKKIEYYRWLFEQMKKITK